MPALTHHTHPPTTWPLPRPWVAHLLQIFFFIIVTFDSLYILKIHQCHIRRRSITSWWALNECLMSNKGAKENKKKRGKNKRVWQVVESVLPVLSGGDSISTLLGELFKFISTLSPSYQRRGQSWNYVYPPTQAMRVSGPPPALSHMAQRKTYPRCPGQLC